MVILIAVGLCNIIARILLLKTVLIWRGVRVSDGAAGGRSEGQGLVFFLSIMSPSPGNASMSADLDSVSKA